MKRKHLFGKGIIVALGLVILFYVGRWAFFNILHQDDVLDGMVELRTQVMRSMEEGNETDIFYVRNVAIKEITDINRYVDSAFGDVSTYRVLVSSGDYLAIQFSYNKSENYYVIRKAVFGEEIPSDKTRALQMYDAYMEFYDSYIHEPMSDFDKEIAAHDYLVKNCKYGFAEDEQNAYDAYGVLVDGKAVCDGYAEAFFMLMTCLDINCDIVVGMADGELHAWNQVELGGDWYNVDLTWDDAIPDMGEYVKHTYVNINDEALSASHEWEREFYHVCTNDAYNYYNKILAVYENVDDFKSGILKQAGRSNVLEAIIFDLDESKFNLTFLYDSSNIRKVKYLIEDMGSYSVVIIYINT